ncbi:MAG: hypothetical protein WBL74_09070 [Novosphingobium sp.]|uniref:hypothetical protein n=1 Tax=Novosphingobium sp. TaxID=1874826 RepID=UPI003C7E6471
MNRINRLLGTVGAAALVVTSASPAFAGGTTAGSTITNTVTVNYQVGAVAQTATGASNTFTVDRKVNLTVAEVGTTTTQVSPGQTAAVTTFTVTNTSNATLDFALVAAQQTGLAGAHSNTDNFDVTNVKIYVDTNGNGSYDAGTDTLVTYLDELAADASKTVFVVADIPLGQVTNDVAAVTLTATGREGGGATAQGAALTETTGANTAGMDTVFADGAGATDAVRNADYSAKDDYTVLAAALTISKLSTVISDPINGTTNPKLIPGATIEYCIVVNNAAGSATATNVAISDPLPTTVTYSSGYGTFLNGTVTSGVCNFDGTAGGSFASGTVSGTLSSVAAGETKTLRFRAVIN